MKIVIAPNAFKETLGAPEVAQTVAAACAAEIPQCECVCLPQADGGDGTVEALLGATGGRRMSAVVSDPLGRPVRAGWGLLGDGRTAVIEMAAASGLHLVPPDRRNPLQTTSFGTGQLIRQALAHDIATLILGLGGSATVDAGLGLLQGLGMRFCDRAGTELPPGGAGATLARVGHAEMTGLDPALAHVRLRVACDVDNPLLGPRGAAAVYGPQKGATPGQVDELERGLANFHALMTRLQGRDVGETPGAGAAGGAGAALAAFLGARLERGAALVIEASGLAQHLEGADLVVTGEGRLDRSTLDGKAPLAVAQLAKAAGVPVLAVCGVCETGARPQLERWFKHIVPCPALGAERATDPRPSATTALSAGVREFLRSRWREAR